MINQQPGQFDLKVAEFRDWTRRNPMGMDVLLAVGMLALVWMWSTTAFMDPLALLIALGYTVPLVWRRSSPELACVLVFPVHLLQLTDPSLWVYASYFYGGFPMGNIVVPILLYSMALYSKHAIWGLAIGLIGALAVGLRWASRYWWAYYPTSELIAPAISVAVITFATALVVVCSWGLGRMLRYQRDTQGLAQGRAEALEREAEQIRRLAAEQERSRIAREMHDIIAHSLSVIVVQADGASYAIAQPGDQGRQLVVAGSALDVIGTTARTALAETRRLVGVLRSDQQETELAPMVNLAAIGELINKTRATGLPIEVCFEGDPGVHPPLGAGVEAAAYRIVQEALTNVLKHAGPQALANVNIEHTPVGLQIEMRDDGQGPRASDGAGHGLIGMHERVAAFGGTLVARPRPIKGFEIIATLPAQGAQPPTTNGRLVP